MTWVIWRSHRTALLASASALAALALVMAAVAGSGNLDVVLGADGSARRQLSSAAVGLTLLGPALAGAFFGAPLLAADLERGTHVLLLTQAVSRRRWATTSLLLVGGAAVVAVVAVTLVVRPLSTSVAWYSLENFSATGALPLARTLSAFALGALIGLLVRRVLAASALTLAAGIVSGVALVALREVLVPPVLRAATAPYGGDVDTRRDQLIDYGGDWVLVRPLELRWPMHWVEVGLHLLLAAGALALLYLRLRRPLGR